MSTPSRGPSAGRRAGTSAGLGRRLAALVVDWLAAVAISAGFFGYEPLATLVIFFTTTTTLVGTLGFTIGHRIAGIGVRTTSGEEPGLGRAALRTAALCLVLPAVLSGADGRGMHDRWASTQIVRLP